MILRLITVSFVLVATGTISGRDSRTSARVPMAHAETDILIGQACMRLQGFMGLEHGMDKLRKIQDSKGTHFSKSSGQVETFPSPLSIMVLINQHCGYLAPDIAGDSNPLKDLDLKIEWYDGKERRPVEKPTIDREVSSLKELLQTLTYRIHISAEEVPIVTHLLVTLSSDDKQLASLDLHF
jgi:hypothetical protein